MLSPNKNKFLHSNSKLAILSLLVGLGLILFLFESLIPRPLPWLKPGLAHIATLIAIYLLGARSALIVVILRVILGSLILGTLFNPTFIFAFGGSVSATITMSIMNRYFPTTFSIFGISISGAVVHNLTQLFLVEVLIVRQLAILYLAPLMILSSLFTGFIVALATYLLLNRIEPILNGIHH